LNAKQYRLFGKTTKSRKVLWAAIGFGVLVWAVWSCFFAARPSGIQVPPSKVPPPAVVSILTSNAPIRIWPGVTGTFFVLPDGSLWEWGQPGGSVSPRIAVPARVGIGTDWVEAIAPNNHCLGLRKDGTLWEWGWRGNAVAPSLAPVQVGSDHDWSAIAAGDVHSVALKRDGTLWAWGDNAMGQLGNGGGSAVARPTQIGTNDDWAAISCAQGSYTYGIRKDGTLWVWGEVHVWGASLASRRALTPSSLTFPTPTQVCRDTNWVRFLSGSDMVENRSGQWFLPLKAPPDPKAPASSLLSRMVGLDPSPHRFAFASCGFPMLFQIRSDGSLWERINPNFPIPHSSSRWTRVGRRSDWLAIRGDGGTAFGITSDGTVWMWGTDVSQEPILDRQSRLRKLKYDVANWVRDRVNSWFGPGAAAWFGASRLSTTATFPYQKNPRPLLRITVRARR
jgi:alpha-tubulin suppressor-like RCC1 family protein